MREGGFQGGRVVTCAVVDNHFHLVAEVPCERVAPNGEIVRSFAAPYPETAPWQPLSAVAL